MRSGEAPEFQRERGHQEAVGETGAQDLPAWPSTYNYISCLRESTVLMKYFTQAPKGAFRGQSEQAAQVSQPLFKFFIFHSKKEK
jgi:hypothetical protein